MGARPLLDSSSRAARLGALAFTSLAHATNDGMVIYVSFAADFLATTQGAPPLETAVMLFLFNLASAALSVFVGRWADRSGRAGALISLGLALVSAGILGFYLALVLARGPALVGGVMAAALVAGFGTAFYHPLGGTIIQTAFEGPSRGLALGANGSVGSLGRALYPFVFFLVPAIVTIYDPLAVFAVVGFVVSGILWVGLHAWRAPSLPSAGSLPPANGEARSIRDAATRGSVLLTAVVFIRSMATQGIVSFLPIYITQLKGAGLGQALGVAIAAMYTPAIFGQPVFGWLVDHYDRRVVLGLSSLASGVCILAYLFSTGWVSVAFLAAFGLFTFSGFPLFLSLAADYVPREAASMGNALVWGIGSGGGSVLGPIVVGGIIASDYGLLGLAFEVLAGVALVSALGTGLLPRKSTASGTPPTRG